ncbi:GDSL-type esterase/lipase family protein [Alicyclobacillus ferrooxydans]|uniref:GDSL-type esterase/lipase family protein n=1 Tax=Alicyclobacillus ferrooxydans TaxID=471514 RepID=UPI0006D57F8D|nr:GDSL-type esterase/lipase family protein [Alicyclobacillus ferrooxydans]
MEQDKPGSPQGKHDSPINQPKPPRRKSSDRVIQSASGLAITAAVVLIGGFLFASYAAFGGTVGHILGATGGTSGTNGTSVASGGGGGTSGTTGSGTGGGSGTTGSGTGGASGGVNGGTVGGSTGGNASQGSTPQQTGQPQLNSKTIHLVALGDSLTHGLGDASGEGYVGDVAANLKQAGYSVIQANLGIDGLTSQGLRTEVVKPEVTQLLQSANLVLISIGGNDLNDAAGLPAIHTARIAKARTQFLSNLNAVLSTIRSVNKNATVLVIGLYNPYGNIAGARLQTDSIVETWNADEQALVSKYNGVLMVQTYDLFQLNPTRYLYIDHFHPNQAGYQRIATRVWQDVQSVIGG